MVRNFGENSNTASCMESKQKTWALIKQQCVLGSGGMQYNVSRFGGHPILLAGFARNQVFSNMKHFVFKGRNNMSPFRYSKDIRYKRAFCRGWQKPCNMTANTPRQVLVS
jgi:hypothetical protein